MFNIKSLSIYFVLALFVSISPEAIGKEFALTVLHTNDFHARYEPVTHHGSACSEKKIAAGKCFGGISRLSFMVNKLRKESKNTILVDAGDQFQGSLHYLVYFDKVVSEFMNLLRYDAMAVGNHEFDEGPEVLGKFTRKVNFPVISANIDVTRSKHLKNQIKPYVIKSVNGEKIGIIGLTTPDTPILAWPGKNVKFSKPLPPLTKAVKELTKQKVNKIVVLSHLGLNVDQELAKKVSGVDLYVSGHTHSLLDSSKSQNTDGPYPIVETAPDGNRVLLVSAFNHGIILGKTELIFDAQGKIIKYSGKPIRIEYSTPMDKKAKASLASYSKGLEKYTSKIVGESTTFMDGTRDSCRYKECKMGNLIADAFLWKTRNLKTTIALQNGGGIRSSIPTGKINFGQVLKVLPFGNEITVIKIKGKDLIQAIEDGVAKSVTKKQKGNGRFLQVSGLKYRWSPTKPLGKRVSSVLVRGKNSNYAPIKREKVYSVVTNNFIASGGDGHETLGKKGKITHPNIARLDQTLIEYIKKSGKLSPKIEGRITKK